MKAVAKRDKDAKTEKKLERRILSRHRFGCRNAERR